jgi:hypothetical protein
VIAVARAGIGPAGDAGGVHPPGRGKGLGTVPSRNAQLEQIVIASTMVTVGRFMEVLPYYLSDSPDTIAQSPDDVL